MTVQVRGNTRRYKRHSIDVPIRVIVHRTSKTTVFMARGHELSEGGMALTAGVELKPGDETEVEFTPVLGHADSYPRDCPQPVRLPIRNGVCRGRCPGVRTGRPPPADAGGNEFHLTLTRGRL
jgi:hypothetical protein